VYEPGFKVTSSAAVRLPVARAKAPACVAAEGMNRASDQRMVPDRVGADFQQPLGQQPKASRIPATVSGHARNG
jgi:hypothetical protein